MKRYRPFTGLLTGLAAPGYPAWVIGALLTLVLASGVDAYIVVGSDLREQLENNRARPVPFQPPTDPVAAAGETQPAPSATEETMMDEAMMAATDEDEAGPSGTADAPEAGPPPQAQAPAGPAQMLVGPADEVPATAPTDEGSGVDTEEADLVAETPIIPAAVDGEAEDEMTTTLSGEMAAGEAEEMDEVATETPVVASDETDTQAGPTRAVTLYVKPSCRRLLLAEGDYLSYALERWVDSCLDKITTWTVGAEDTHLDYELTQTRMVELPLGFHSLQEYLKNDWGLRALEAGRRVVFDDEIEG